MSVPKVAAIHDLSGLGRCSLTAAIPILSVMGVQVCPLPTAALSNQTGYPSFESVDLSGHLESFARQWSRLGMRFDGVYTGFLFCPEQVQLVGRLLETLSRPDTLLLVDPVLGDHGAYYPVFDDEMTQAFGELIRRAAVITPNLTEACFLTGQDYHQVLPLIQAGDLSPAREMARRLGEMGPAGVVLTGLPGKDAFGRDTLSNLGLMRGEEPFVVTSLKWGGGYYSGTGDILASVLCGGLMRGRPLQESLQKAGALLEHAIRRTCAEGEDPNGGVAFEPYLSLLV